MLDTKKIKEIDNFILNIHPISDSASKILEISKKKGAGAMEFYDIIKYDPVLTGKILKFINSSYYSLPNPILSLVRAIIMLGINTVKNMVLSYNIIDIISNNGKQEKNSKLFLEHSVCVGTLAKAFFLEKEPDSEKSEEYFIAGLLHDIGKFPLFSILSDEYNKFYEKSLEQNISMIKIETEEFGFNHTDIGEKILNMWELGPSLANVIKYHHNIFEIPKTDGQFTAIICLADMVLNRLNMGFYSNLYTDEEFEQILLLSEISYDLFIKIENNSKEIIKKSNIFL